MSVVPVVPQGQITLNETISDPVTTSQYLTVNADGSIKTLMKTGANFVGYTSGGGAATANVATDKGSATVIKASAGVLCRVLVTAANTAALVFYDNASAASGTIIGRVAGSAAVGSILDFQSPAANGITVDSPAACPAFTVGYI